MTAARIGPPGYADVNKVGAAYVAGRARSGWCGAATGRIPTRPPSPTTPLLFDLLAQWAPNEATRHRILVENPETLYGFPKVS